MSDDDDDKCEAIKDWTNSQSRLEENWSSIFEKYERLSKIFACDDDDDESTSFEIGSFVHTSKVDKKTKIASTILEGVVDRDFGVNIELRGVISDDDSDTDIEDEDGDGDGDDDEIQFIGNNTLQIQEENKISEEVFSVVSCAASCCEKSFKKCVSVVGWTKTEMKIDFCPDEYKLKPCFVSVRPLSATIIAKTCSNFVADRKQSPPKVKPKFLDTNHFRTPTNKFSPIKRKLGCQMDAIFACPTKKSAISLDIPRNEFASSLVDANLITLKIPKSILEVIKTRRVDDILSGFLNYERHFLSVDDERPSERLRPYVERELRIEKYNILLKHCPLKEFQILYKNSPSITEFDDFVIDADLVKWKK